MHIIILAFLLPLAVINGTAQVTAQDGSKYNTVKIGDSEWLANNLNVSTFNNGTPIFKVTSMSAWLAAYNEKRPAYCYYHFQDSNAVKFGALYNWYAVISPARLAPLGWHIPNSTEWSSLVSALGEVKSACSKLKTNKGWEMAGTNGNGSNSSGFGAVPAGMLNENGTSVNNYFVNGGHDTAFWSTTDRPQGLPDGFLIGYDCGVNAVSRKSGYSVRCIKDK